MWDMQEKRLTATALGLMLVVAAAFFLPTVRGGSSIRLDPELEFDAGLVGSEVCRLLDDPDDDEACRIFCRD